MTTEPTDLDELERLEKAATPGPWCSVDYTIFASVQSSHDFGGRDLFSEKSIHFPGSENFRWRENGKLAAAARNALPALIAELRAARELLQTIHDELEPDEPGWSVHVHKTRIRAHFDKHQPKESP